MSNTTAAFISNLIRAANEVDRLTKDERASLLLRASGTIQDMRYEINFSGSPANDNDPLDIVMKLQKMARLIKLFSAGEVSVQLLGAVEIIKVLQVLLEVKNEVRRDKE